MPPDISLSCCRTQGGAYDVGVGGCALLVVECPVGGCVHRRAWLLPPAVGEGPRINGPITDRVQELGDRRFGRCAVSRDRQGRAIGGTRRAGQVEEMLEENV